MRRRDAACMMCVRYLVWRRLLGLSRLREVACTGPSNEGTRYDLGWMYEKKEMQQQGVLGYTVCIY